MIVTTDKCPNNIRYCDIPFPYKKVTTYCKKDIDTDFITVSSNFCYECRYFVRVYNFLDSSIVCSYSNFSDKLEIVKGLLK